MPVQYRICQTTEELNGILALQKQNLRYTHTLDVESDQGFVTVSHTIELLSALNDEARHIIAVDDDQVVGYALAMTEKFRATIPELISMFEMIDDLNFKGNRLNDVSYLVMGQVCIGASHRGKGVFSDLYKFYFEYHRMNFDFLITEVAQRNTRSMRAHKKVGFETIHTYDEIGSETWVVIGKQLKMV